MMLNVSTHVMLTYWRGDLSCTVGEIRRV